MTNYTIYRHTFPNNKLYFGITSQPVLERWRKDGSGYKKNPRMWCAIKKYGWENIQHDILFDGLSEEQANHLEVELIKCYNTQDSQFGYNILPGGLVASGGHHTEESKKKMSMSQIGRRTGYIAWNRGLSYGKQKVYQYSLDGTFIAEFANAKDASIALNIPAANIFDNMNGKSKSCYGFFFSKRKLSAEEVRVSSASKRGAPKVTIYQYGPNGNLLGTYISYETVMRELQINESALNDCLNNRQKTTHGFVLSKVLLTKDEVLSHYVIAAKKPKYKYLLINKFTNEQKLYNTVEAMAEELNVKSTVLRNVINGSYSKLHKTYLFKKELNNEN